MFFNNYLKPGKGVEKRDPNQPRIQIFFDILPRKLFELFKLNILYLLMSTPFYIITMVVMGIITSPLIVALKPMFDNVSLIRMDVAIRAVLTYVFTIFLGHGSTTAGYTYIMREYGREHHCWLISDFVGRTKSNFKQGMMIWIIDLFALLLFVVALRFYMQMKLLIFQCVILVLCVLYLMMHIYVYQMMVTFMLPLKSILKNSFILIIAKTSSSFLILILNIIIYIIIPIVVVLSSKNIMVTLIIILIEILVLLPITNFAINFYIEPVLNKYINIKSKNNKQKEE